MKTDVFPVTFQGRARSPGSLGYRLSGYVYSALRHLTNSVIIADAEWIYRVDTRDRVIGRSLFMGNSPEVDGVVNALEFVESVCGATYLKDRSVIDVGANIGTTVVPAIRRFNASRVWAFEPDGRNLELLTVNARLNGIESNLEILPVAISDHSGFMSLERSAVNYGDHRLKSEVSPGGLRVPVMSLDHALELLPELASGVGLLWMDVQGHEGQVLQGASRLLQMNVPIVMEFWPAGIVGAGGKTMVDEVLNSGRYAIYDVRHQSSGTRELDGRAIGTLWDDYRDSYTDLLLAPLGQRSD